MPAAKKRGRPYGSLNLKVVIVSMRARIVALWQRSVCNLSNATRTVLLVNIRLSFRYPSSMSFATTVLEANDLSNGLCMVSPLELQFPGKK